MPRCRNSIISIFREVWIRCQNTFLKRNFSTESAFREHVLSTCGAEGSYIIASFSRQMLGQTGDGHFAAISGYHPEQDMILVMDTAKFKYPAFWCPLKLL